MRSLPVRVKLAGGFEWVARVFTSFEVRRGAVYARSCKVARWDGINEGDDYIGCGNWVLKAVAR